MVTFASGNALRVPFFDPLLVKREKRTSKSKSLLLPNAKIFGERKLVMTPNAALLIQHMKSLYSLRTLDSRKGFILDEPVFYH